MSVYVCERVGHRKHHSEVYGRRLYLVNKEKEEEDVVVVVEQSGYLNTSSGCSRSSTDVVHSRLVSGVTSVANLVPPSVTAQLLWPLATTNYGGQRPQR